MSAAVLMVRASVSSVLVVAQARGSVSELGLELGWSSLLMNQRSILNSSRSLSRLLRGCAGLEGSDGGPAGQ